MSAAMLVPLVSGDTLTIALFLVVVALTLYITFWASRQSKTTTDYYAGGRSFSGFQNGLAVSGDYMSAASFLGISGAIAIYGYDGFLYSIGFLVAWLVALLLIAELFATRAGSQWPTSWRIECVRHRSAVRQRHRRLLSRSSTCWPRWSAPEASSACSSGSTARL